MSKLIALCVSLVALCLPVSAQGLFPLQPHPADLAWPTTSWETAAMPEQTAAIVEGLISDAMSKELSDTMGETRAVVIIHNGKLVAEAYRDGFDRDTKQVSWSMAKSVTQALVGRAVHLGLIENIDAPMPTPFKANDPRNAITWREWLNMTDGLDYKNFETTPFIKLDVVQMMYGPGKYDVVDYVEREVPLRYEPGTRWAYSTEGFHLLGWAFHEATADAFANAERDSVAAKSRNIQSVLFEPLGMDAQPEFDEAGTFLGGSLVWASAQDFAKFGYLYLRDGVWEGERLLPEGWVDFARTETPADNANVYGAGWWVTPAGVTPSNTQSATTPPWDAFHAGGNEGQTTWVVPSRDLVIVRLGLMNNAGENWPALYEWNQQIARAFPKVE